MTSFFDATCATVEPIPDADIEVASVEGWIALPTGTLASLAGRSEI
jgi:hypothetical protein